MDDAPTIFKFHLDCGRMGDLRSVIISTPNIIAKAIGRYVYFGEVLGKHSEIAFDLAPEHLTAVTNDPSAVKLIAELGLDLGLNPLASLRCANCRENESDADDLSCGYCREVTP